MASQINKLTGTQLAAACGCSSAAITKARKAGRIDFVDGKYYDITLRKTKVFIRDLEIKTETKFNLVRAFESVGVKLAGRPKAQKPIVDARCKPENQPEPPQNPLHASSGITEAVANGSTEDDDLINWGEEKKRLDCRKAELDIERKDLDNARVRGELLPVDEAGVVVNYIITEVSSSMQNGAIGELALMVKELGGTDEDFKVYSQRLRDRFPDFISEGKESASLGIEGIVEDFKNRAKL